MSARQTILIVDDEPDIRELLEITLGRMKLETRSARDVKEAREWLARESFDLCLTDMRLPDGTGLELVQFIQQRYPQVPVAMITAFGSLDTAINALKAGAFDFLTKPVDLPRLRELVGAALRMPAPAPAGKEPSIDQRLLGSSPAMDELRATISKVARSQAPVYILGESGVGKELVARTIHDQGARAAGPFIPVNCGAIPSELMESEFFGHRKGSFTGAHADKPGLFQAASGGTLFLDEVAELPLQMQVKLLRAIQEKSVRPVGAATEVTVDVRILSATHKDLGTLVQDGRFRHDLYYRINVIELRVPPLRERRGDLPQLASTILNRLALAQAQKPPRLAASALEALDAYSFPGNVRELENILERSLALADSDCIDASDLRLPQPQSATPRVPSSEPPAPAAAPQEAVVDIDPASAALPSYIEQMERTVIQKALEENRWNKTKTAAQLGITFRALRYKLKKLGME